MTAIDLGIAEPQRKELASGLGVLLADTYTLYLKSHNYHWNVEGPMFRTLHLMFEEHYNEMWVAVDEIAERIRSLGEPAPATYAEFSKLSSIDEPKGVPEAMDMVRDLVTGHEAVVRTARWLVGIAEEAEDQATADLATQRLAVHEKTAWMLRAMVS
jgi:starvation-inducible DNA-binding protein